MSGPRKKPPVDVKCEWCGTIFPVSPHAVGERRFCKPKCFHDSTKGKEQKQGKRRLQKTVGKGDYYYV